MGNEIGTSTSDGNKGDTLEDKLGGGGPFGGSGIPTITPDVKSEGILPEDVGYAVEDGIKHDSLEKHVVVEKPIKERDFEKLKVVGKGLFGVVYLVKKKSTGKFYAMKKMDKIFIVQKKSVRHIKSERFLLAGIYHPFIINLRFAFQDKKFLFLVMDYMPGGTLFQHLRLEKMIPEERVKIYAAELVLAIQFLHESNVLHRDLKLENILVDQNGHVILTDFGLSKLIRDETKNRTICGTLDYLSPEMVLVSKKKLKGYGRAVDWYAFGVIMYELLYGVSPFAAKNLKEAMDKILHQKIRFPRTPKVSREAKDLIKGLLRKNPDKRFGTRSAELIKAHPFFGEINFERLYNRQVEMGWSPDVSGPDDTKYVSKRFLKMPLTWEGRTEKKEGRGGKGYTPEDISKVNKAFDDFDFKMENSLRPNNAPAQEKEEEGEKFEVV